VDAWREGAPGSGSAWLGAPLGLAAGNWPAGATGMPLADMESV